MKDGGAISYPLKTGFRFETRLKAPTEATIHFGPPPSANVGSFHGLMLTVDATQTGMHYADGDEIRATSFARKNLAIGTPARQGRKAVLVYYAEGGQMFPPKTGCAIEIVSPYTADAASVMEGRVAECTVHSAGIDYTLSSVRFTVRGLSRR